MANSTNISKHVDFQDNGQTYCSNTSEEPSTYENVSNSDDEVPLIDDPEHLNQSFSNSSIQYNKRLKRSAIGLSVLSAILIGLLIFCIIAILNLKTKVDKLEKQCPATTPDTFYVGK